MIYAVLMKLWGLHAYLQAETVPDFNDRYLATNVDHNKVYAKYTGFSRVQTKDLTDDTLRCEDL